MQQDNLLSGIRRELVGIFLRNELKVLIFVKLKPRQFLVFQLRTKLVEIVVFAVITVVDHLSFSLSFSEWSGRRVNDGAHERRRRGLVSFLFLSMFFFSISFR